jgi:FkbM family methyltransferase
MNSDLLFENITCEIHSLLDIGCFVGNFSTIFASKFSLDEDKILCVDINQEYKELIESKGFRFMGVGLSSHRKNVPVYYPKEPTSLHDPRNSGVSYYKENTEYFSNCLITTQEVFPLDSVTNGETFDFVKIDVQGAEYDVIEGGKELLKKSKYILVETSCGDYNLGSKEEIKTVELLNSIGFQQKVILHEAYRKGILQQRDILFEKVS